MKIHLNILIGLIICGACNQKQVHTKSVNEDQKKTNTRVKSSVHINDIDGLLENVQYLAFNGVVTDTVYLDSLLEIATIHDSIKVENKVYLSYVVHAKGESARGKKVSNFQGHFINSIELEEFPIYIGKTFEYNMFKSSDTALNLGSSCSNADDRIMVENVDIFPVPDSCLLFYLKIPQCSEWLDHTIVKYATGHFEKLFVIESTDYMLDFKLRNDSILHCHYGQLGEESSESFDFEYNYKTNQVIN